MLIRPKCSLANSRKTLYLAIFPTVRAGMIIAASAGMSSLALPLTLTNSQSDASAFRLGHRPVLDGVRAISILFVLIHHTEFITPISLSILRGGYVGVDIFFVLSGFLITSLLVEEFETTGTISFRMFYMRRVLRLLPAVGAVLLFSVAVGGVIGFNELGLNGWRVFSVVGYFTNWVRAYETPDLWFLTHFWSLAIEEQFYLVWPLVLVGLLRSGLTRRGILFSITALILCSVIQMAVLQSSGATVLRLYTGSDTRAHSLLGGCLFSLALHWGYIKIESAKRYQTFAQISLIILIASAFLVHISTRILYTGGSLIIAICAGILILGLVIGDKSRLGALFSHPVMLWLGKRSYGLYIWHWPVFYLCSYLRRPAIAIPCGLIGALIAAAVSYRFIELPFLRMKEKYSVTGKGQVKIFPASST